MILYITIYYIYVQVEASTCTVEVEASRSGIWFYSKKAGAKLATDTYRRCQSLAITIEIQYTLTNTS